MRGRHDPQATMLAFVDLEERVPTDHPLRTIKVVADEALERLSAEFDGIEVWSVLGWPGTLWLRPTTWCGWRTYYRARSPRPFSRCDLPGAQCAQMT